MESPGVNSNPIIRKQIVSLVLAFQKGILEMWFKKIWLVKNRTIWIISLASRPSFFPPLNFLHDPESNFIIMFSSLAFWTIYFRNVGTIMDFRILEVEGTSESLMTIHWDILKFSLIMYMYHLLKDIGGIMYL